MKTEHEERGAKRRDFLKLAGAGSLTAAAAAVATTPAVAETRPDDRTGGYRETAHVKKAYQLARF